MSAARRGATGLSGIMPIDKPAGMTSHDVVGFVRRVTGERRVGHAGTLDPMATGLLVVLIGPATRLEQFVSASYKTYEATIAFGAETDTEDAEGSVVATAPVPPAVLRESDAQRVLDAFLGESMQVPPQYSALKVDGKTAHRVARGGGEIELAARPIDVTLAELESVDATSATWRAIFRVSKGTYIRSLARDIGRAAGTAAHLAGLRRIESGALSLDRDANSLEEVERAAADGRIESLFCSALAVLGMPFIEIDEEAAAAVRVGRELRCPDGLADGSLVALVRGGHVCAVYRRVGEALRPEVVLARPA